MAQNFLKEKILMNGHQENFDKIFLTNSIPHLLTASVAGEIDGEKQCGCL